MLDGKPRSAKMVVSKLLKEAEKRAATKGVPFSNDCYPKIHSQLLSGFCQATGGEMDVAGNIGKLSAWSPTLDRIVPELGYVPENVRVVSFAYNAMKGQEDDRFCIALACMILQENGWLPLPPEILETVRIVEK